MMWDYCVDPLQFRQMFVVISAVISYVQAAMHYVAASIDCLSHITEPQCWQQIVYRELTYQQCRQTIDSIISSELGGIMIFAIDTVLYYFWLPKNQYRLRLVQDHLLLHSIRLRYQINLRLIIKISVRLPLVRFFLKVSLKVIFDFKCDGDRLLQSTENRQFYYFPATLNRKRISCDLGLP